MALFASSDQEELWPLLKFGPIHGYRTILDAFSRHNRINSLYKNVLIISIKSFCDWKYKKIHQRPCRQTPLSGPFTPGEGVEIPFPLLFNPQPSSIFNSWACPSDFSKLSLFHTLFYWSGAEKSHTRGCCGPRSRALLWANASLAHQFFIEWLENSKGLARKMAGIMPLSTFDLTSMQRLASDTRGFTFCGVDLCIVVRGILWDVFVDRMGTQVSMGPSRISTPLSEESAYFSFLMSHLDPCIQLVRANP